MEHIESPKCGCFPNNSVEKRKQLPKDPEAKRCVLIVIEDELGVILRIEKEEDNEYAVWTPYKTTFTNEDNLK